MFEEMVKNRLLQCLILFNLARGCVFETPARCRQLADNVKTRKALKACPVACPQGLTPPPRWHPSYCRSSPSSVFGTPNTPIGTLAVEDGKNLLLSTSNPTLQSLPSPTLFALYSPVCINYFIIFLAHMLYMHVINPLGYGNC